MIWLIAVVWWLPLASSMAIEVGCPPNILVEPFQEDIHDTFTCFEMNGQLKICKYGQNYNSELDACTDLDIRMTTNRTSSFKNVMTLDREATTTSAAEKTIVQPGLGRSICLGCLYYGTEDRVSESNHFWRKSSLTGDKTRKRVLGNKDGRAEFSTSTLDRLNNFDVEAQLALSFMGGLVSVSGSAKYLSEKRLSVNSVDISYIYEYVANTESITQEAKMNLDYPNLCNQVGKTGGPTHVVASVTRGQKAVFDFQYETKDESSNSEVGGSLMVAIKAIPSFRIDGKATIGITETEEINASDLKCSFKSDFDLKSIPTTFNEAVKSYKSLVDLENKDTENVLKFTLEPIKNYCGDVQTILNEISEKDIDDIQTTLQELEQLELEAYSLTISKAALTYSGTLGKAASLFLTKLKTYSSDWKQGLKQNLPYVRGGSKAAQTDLANSLVEYVQSPFNFNRAIAFLKHRKKEFDTVELAMNEEGIPGIIVDDGSSDVNKCAWNKDYLVKFELNILPDDDELEQYIKSKEDWSEPEHWYDDNVKYNTAASFYRDFKTIRQINPERNDVCFIVKLGHLTDASYANIVAYDQYGIMIKDNLRLLDHPGDPQIIYARYDSIEFEIPAPTDAFANIISVSYNVVGAVKTTTKTFPVIPGSLKKVVMIDELDPNTLYQFKIAPSSVVGNLAVSREFQASTNGHSEPQNLRIEQRSDSEFVISWDKPHTIAPNINITSYVITARRTRDGEEIKRNMPVDPTDGNVYSATITGLDYSTQYNIEVESSVGAGFSQQHVTRLDYKAAIQESTLPRAPQAPSVVPDKTTQHSISLHWDAPDRLAQGSDVTSYIVMYQRVGPDTANPLVPNSEHTAYSVRNEIALQNLAAGGTYQFKVSVSTVDGTSEYSAPTISTTKIEKTELENFRDSLGLVDMGVTIDGKYKTSKSIQL